MAAISLALGLPLTSCGPEAVPDGRPNIILVCVDTLRADALGIYGAGAGATPHLDELARESVVFEQAFSVSSWTKPAVPSLHTGLYPSEHGVFATSRTSGADVLSDSVVTLAEVLDEAGYETAAFVENVHLKKRYSGLAQGFDTYVEDAGDAPEIVERVLDWRSRSEGGPFFAYIHMLDPHWPYTPRALSDERRVAPEIRERVVHWDLTGPRWWLVRDATRDGRMLLAADDVSALRTLYQMEVAELDATLGRLVALLDVRDVLDSTLFVLTSDHGEGFYEHARLDHGYGPYDELLRVPLLMRFPKARYASTKVSEAVQIVGVASTIEELVSPQQRVLPDRSLLPLIEGGRGERGGDRAVIFAEERHGDTTIEALRTGRYKYIRTTRDDRELSPDPARVPVDLVAGARVQIEGVYVSEAFIGADVRQIEPGDDDCELHAPLSTDGARPEVLRILGSALEWEPGKTKLTGPNGNNAMQAPGATAWVRAHGEADPEVFAARKIELFDSDARQKLEIEGVIEGVRMDGDGHVWLHLCARDVRLSDKVMWREFAADSKSVMGDSSVRNAAGGVSEELYELDVDPNEKMNVAAERRDVTAALSARLDEFAGSLDLQKDSHRNSEEIDSGTRQQLQALGYLE